MSRFIKRALLICGIGAAILVVAVGVTIGPTMYRVMIGLHRYETTPPQLSDRLNSVAILIFSKTNGYRDDEAVVAANAALAGIAERRGWSAVVTENGAVFNPEQLRRFKAVVWNNVSGDVLTPEQRAVFRKLSRVGWRFRRHSRSGRRSAVCVEMVCGHADWRAVRRPHDGAAVSASHRPH